MKNLSFFNVLFLALAIFGISSCGSDDSTTVDPILIPPTISAEITSTAGATVAPGATFTVQVTAAPGDSSLRSLTIQEAGTTIDATTRILIDGIEPSNNPQFIAGGAGFTWDLTITAHPDEAEVEYTFEVDDNGGEVATASLLINTIGAAVAPMVTFNGADPVNVAPGSAANISISATATSDIASIGVWKGGDLIDITTEVTDYDGTAMTANPQELEAGFTSLDMVNITIRPTSSGVYSFQVTDANGLTDQVDVNVVVGTVATEITGVLLNSAGPSGTGGLDLDPDPMTGMATGTGSMDAAAEIKDEGINGNPLATNWVQKISAANSAVLKYAGNLPDGSGYADVNTVEGIQGAFDNSDDLTGGVSDVVVVGDEFVVENNGTYYFLLVTDVTIDEDGNDDSYTFSIKQ